MQADGSYVLDGVLLSERALAIGTGRCRPRRPATIVAITTSEDADYQAFTDALAAARNGGITNIALER